MIFWTASLSHLESGRIIRHIMNNLAQTFKSQLPPNLHPILDAVGNLCTKTFDLNPYVPQIAQSILIPLGYLQMGMVNKQSGQSGSSGPSAPSGPSVNPIDQIVADAYMGNNPVPSEPVKIPVVLGAAVSLIFLYTIFSAPDLMINAITLVYPLICSMSQIETPDVTNATKSTVFVKYWILCAILHLLKGLGLMNGVFTMGLALYLVSNDFENSAKVYDTLIPFLHKAAEYGVNKARS